MISIVCPSRGRPQLAKRMIDSFLNNPGCAVEILLYLNEDDPKLEQYKDLINSEHYSIGPDRSPGYSWNMLAQSAKHDIIFLMGDDAENTTQDWGNIVLNTFELYPDRIAMVVPSIGRKTKKEFCPHFLLHRNWINALGYFVPPHFHQWYVDSWTREVSKSLNRYILLENFTVPMEMAVGDETDKKYRQTWLQERDQWLDRVTARWRDDDVKTLEKFIADYKNK
jgi:hypothetical protein